MTELNRRTFLAVGSLLASAYFALRPLSDGGRMVDVRTLGAVGDGVHDDADALRRASAMIRSGDTLYFPAGRYRVVSPETGPPAAIALDGVSDVTVRFAPGAELLVEPTSPHRSCHGVLVSGPARGVVLHGVSIRWTTPATLRSIGDGIRAVGFPSDAPPPPTWAGSKGTVENLSLLSCTITGAPATGAILMGCRGVTVTDFHVANTMADGLHLNACQGVTVTGHEARSTGDDGLAFVTYASPGADVGWDDDHAGPFALPALSAWSNSGSRADHVRVSGGRANGVRISGSQDIQVSDVVTEGCAESAFVVDSAVAGGVVAWTYWASRRIRVRDLHDHGSRRGIQVVANNTAHADPVEYLGFDVAFAAFQVDDPVEWGVDVEGDVKPGTGFAAVSLAQGVVRKRTPANSLGILLNDLTDPDVTDLLLDGPADLAFVVGIVGPGGGGAAGHGLDLAQLRRTNGTVTVHHTPV